MSARARDYRSLVPALAGRSCSRAQLDTRKLAKFSVAVIVTGVPAAGRSETVNKLLEWLDPKYVTVHAFGEDDADASHPPLWRYWRKLPAFGRISFYFWGWYGQYMGLPATMLAREASAARSSSASAGWRRCSAPTACASSRFISTSTPTRNASVSRSFAPTS
jgi:hypothetical protein